MPASPIDNNRHTFDRLIDDGLDPAAAAVTYEWHCERCGTRTWRPAAGGTLDQGQCEPSCDADDIRIWCTLAGERWTMGTFADLFAMTPTRWHG